MEVELVKLAMNVIFGVTTREIGFMWNSTDNIELLNQEAQNLKEMKGRVQQHIVTAKNRGELLSDGVQSWVDTAGTHISNAERVLQEEIDPKKTCFNNLKHRHHFGKVALEDIPLLVKHREDGKTFETCVSIPTPKPRFSESRARKNLDGGVGKTTLAVEVAAIVEDDFDFIVFVTVSQNFDVKRVHKEVEVAAMRTKNGEKVLIILDDVWVKLDLYEPGILVGNEHKCKILLTCRNVKVCEAMNAQSTIRIRFIPLNVY
ncbi:NB-ARC domains-containing protein [Artemisia annua]|uniref:NB-ARC domains-containing protein n=1 Tax=Artemisia annua TaxID=35608 RepID=A0A2U1KHS6_ARTAN|nr:NB-ARC domains-containing protein [Artemisia annua]